MVVHAHDPDYLWVTPWWADREAHQANLAVVAKAYQDRPLPDLQ
jgi:hypothetical protein